MFSTELLPVGGHRVKVFHPIGGRGCSAEIRPRVQAGTIKLIEERGGAVAQAARDLDVAESVLRRWLREGASDPQQAFPGHGLVKPEQQKVTQLRREVVKLKAERDILKRAAAYFPKELT